MIGATRDVSIVVVRLFKLLCPVRCHFLLVFAFDFGLFFLIQLLLLVNGFDCLHLVENGHVLIATGTSSRNGDFPPNLRVALVVFLLAVVIPRFFARITGRDAHSVRNGKGVKSSDNFRDVASRM